MNITLQGFVLFLHIGFVIATFMMAAILHAGFHVLPRVATVAEMRSWTRLIHRLEPLLPLSALAILAMGAWLVHLESGEGASWSDAWVLTPLITLIIIEAMAGSLLAPRAKALVKAVDATADGPVPAEIRRMTLDPVAWCVGHVATFGFTGIVFVMAVKPSGGVAWLFPAVGAVVGIILARLQLAAAQPMVAATPPAPAAAATVPGPRTEPAEQPRSTA